MLPLELVVILGLAAYRLTRLATADSISAPWRARLYSWAFADVPGQDEPEARTAWRTWAYEGLTCAVCLGVWITVGVYVLWRWVPSLRWTLALAAVAGAQAVIAQRADA